MSSPFKKLRRQVDEDKARQLKEEPLEKGDLPAMLLAAFLTLVLPALAVILVFCGIIYLVFGLL